MIPAPDATWNSRGYLPHFDSAHVVQHITFHLGDSLPVEVIAQIKEEIKFLPQDRQGIETRKKMHDWIDGGYGSCLLSEPAIARTVENALLFFDGQRYRVFAWVVMPNHVHVLMQTLENWDLHKIVASWKKYTARFIRQYKKEHVTTFSRGAPVISTPLWHREFWDRYIRNEKHFSNAVTYIHDNPVKAGLVAQPEEWPWSSARLAE